VLYFISNNKFVSDTEYYYIFMLYHWMTLTISQILEFIYDVTYPSTICLYLETYNVEW